ncbi:MAG: mobile mystery protein A [Gammaproteobacteria bacterium]|nr:mobile mystery protein A [Gammaproteobacteria bacterium]
MTTKYQQMATNQLDHSLDQLRALSNVERPAKGWVRAIRNALGMTAEQLGRRMGLSQSRVSELEKSEAQGRSSMQTLTRAADALECELVYALLPRSSLSSMLRQRAKQIAEQQVNRVAHSMALENQKPSKKSLQRQVDQLVEKLLSESRSKLWHE